MSINLSIDFNQLKSLITQCGIEEKTELVRMIEKDTVNARFQQLLRTLKTEDLSLEEIIELVRERLPPCSPQP